MTNFDEIKTRRGLVQLEFPYPSDNEATQAPYWVIIDPVYRGKLNVSSVGGMITGIFFSREEAESYLTAKQYNYSPRAGVYCCSGHHNTEYKQAWKEAEYQQKEHPHD